MKKLLLTGIAALLLATGAARANETKWALIITVWNSNIPIVVPGIADEYACKDLLRELVNAKYAPAPPWHGPIGTLRPNCFEYVVKR